MYGSVVIYYSVINSFPDYTFQIDQINGFLTGKTVSEGSDK